MQGQWPVHDSSVYKTLLKSFMTGLCKVTERLSIYVRQLPVVVWRVSVTLCQSVGFRGVRCCVLRAVVAEARLCCLSFLKYVKWMSRW